jgi:hypothetical protein
MSCDPLASTGPGVDVGLLLILGVVLLVLGGVVLRITQRRGRVVAGVLLLLVSAAAVTITAGTSTRVLADSCSRADNSLTVVQTSVMDNLAPGTTPVIITGTVRNNGAETTYLRAVHVLITGIRLAEGAVPGRCGASDYLLLDPLMPVHRTLEAGGTTAFDGASIGLRNTAVNQDSCKGAVVELRYTANPQ